jgi:hypothetical protein
MSRRQGCRSRLVRLKADEEVEFVIAGAVKIRDRPFPPDAAVNQKRGPVADAARADDVVGDGQSAGVQPRERVSQRLFENCRVTGIRGRRPRPPIREMALLCQQMGRPV